MYNHLMKQPSDHPLLDLKNRESLVGIEYGEVFSDTVRLKLQDREILDCPY